MRESSHFLWPDQQSGAAAGVSKWAAAGSVDTGLSFVSFLELYRTDVAKRQITPGRVVKPLDAIEYARAGLPRVL